MYAYVLIAIIKTTHNIISVYSRKSLDFTWYNAERNTGDRSLKKTKIVSCILAIAFLFTGCMSSDAQPINEEDIHFVQFDEIADDAEVAVIHTSVGTIRMVLFPEEAPNTVAHFRRLVKDGFYTNQRIFGQSESNTIITGATDETGGTGKLLTDDGEAIECETTPNLWHFSGAVSVLGYQENRFSQEYYSDSRFFIIGNVDATTDLVNEMEEYDYPLKVINAYKEHGGLPQFTGAYTVFAQVYDGLDIVDTLSQMPTTGDYKELADGVVIESIELSTYGEEAAKDNNKA